MADAANAGGLGDAVESMKAKMKEAPPKAAPLKTTGNTCPTWCGIWSLWRKGLSSLCLRGTFSSLHDETLGILRRGGDAAYECGRRGS